MNRTALGSYRYRQWSTQCLEKGRVRDRLALKAVYTDPWDSEGFMEFMGGCIGTLPGGSL